MPPPLFSDADFLPGEIVFNDLFLDPAMPLSAQADSLKEDLLQVVFPGHRVLDVGWHPDLNPRGEFMIVINDDPQEWKPVISRRCSTIPELKRIVRELVECIRSGSLSRKRPNGPDTRL